MSGLEDLMVGARTLAQRTVQVDAFPLPGVGSLFSSLSAVLADAQDLAQRTARTPQDTARAQILLSAKGLDITNPIISEINLPTSIEPVTQIQPTSVESFLKNERKTALVAAISKAQKNTTDDFHAARMHRMKSSWEAEKEKIREILSTGPLSADNGIATVGVRHAPMYVANMGALDSATVKSAQLVKELVDNGATPLSSILESLQDEDRRREDVDRSWNVMRGMLQPLSRAPLKKNVFALESYENKHQERYKSLMKQHVVNAKRILQSRFRAHIQKELHLAEGTEITSKEIETYAQDRVGAQFQIMPDDWMCVYLAMRSGVYSAATEFARSIHPDLVTAVGQWARSDTVVPLLNSFYNDGKKSNKPFQMAVANILGQIEPQRDHTELSGTVDDYIWLKMNLFSRKEIDDGSALAALQAQLIGDEFGEEYFSAAEAPFRYFQILLLTGQFERAIEFLERQHERVDLRLTTHFAIPLAYSGMLNVSKNIKSDMLTVVSADEEPWLRSGERRSLLTYCRLNFGLLIHRYVSRFARTNSIEAMIYYALLKDYKMSSSNMSLFEYSVTNLVLDNQEWHLVLGDNSKGALSGGLLKNYEAEDSKRIAIISHIAKTAEERGRDMDAIRLYDLADNQDKVISLLNKKLGEIIFSRGAQMATRKQLLEFASVVNSSDRYAARVSATALPILLDFVQFFTLYASEQADKALEVIKSDRVRFYLPTQPEDVNACAANLSSFPDELVANLSHILLCIATCLRSKYRAVRGNGVTQSQGGQQQQLKEIRDHVEALVTYSGQIPYSLPGNTVQTILDIRRNLNQ